MAAQTITRPQLNSTLPSMQLARTPRSARRIALAIVFILLAMVPVLAMAPWTQTVHGSGRAIAFNPVQRPQFIISPIEGRVKKWHVVENSKVKAGQLLVDLVDNDPNILERLREQQLLAMQRYTLSEGRVRDVKNRLQFVEDEREVLLAEAEARIQQADQQVLVHTQEVERAKTDREREQLNYNRVFSLYNDPAGRANSKDQLEEAERRLSLAKAQVPLAEARVKLSERAVDGAKANKAATDKRTNGMIQTENANIKSAESDLASVQQQYNTITIQVERQENQRIYAPTDGRIFRILANAEAGGQLVRPGERLAILVPDIKAGQEQYDPRKEAIASVMSGFAISQPNGLTTEEYPGIVAELLIDGNDLPLVREGDRVLLQFEGWAAVQFAAYPNAAVGTFEGEVYVVDPTADGNNGRFRLLVKPANGQQAWPDESYLRQGVRAQGWVLIKEVRLGYELWRLLNGFPPAREIKEKDSATRLGPVMRK
jgi:membrane fusion protein, adhesin transport system